MLLVTHPSGFIFTLLCVGFVALCGFIIVKCWTYIVGFLAVLASLFALGGVLALIQSGLFWTFVFCLIFGVGVLYIMFIFFRSDSSSSTKGSDTGDSDTSWEYERPSGYTPREERAYLEAERIKEIRRHL